MSLITARILKLEIEILCERLALSEAEGDILPLGETDALGLIDPLGEIEIEKLADGEMLKDTLDDGLRDLLGESDALGEIEALGEMLRLTLLESEAEGEILGLTDVDGDILPLGLKLALGETLADGTAAALTVTRI